MADVLIVSEYNKFISRIGDFKFDAPFCDMNNVLSYSPELEDYLMKNDINYMKLDIDTFNAMR